jgi:hypothetical protein
VRITTQDVLLSSGQTIPLRDLFKDRPLALIFLRHLGCPYCRRQVAQLKRRPGLNVAFVTMATPEDAEEFRLKYHSAHPVLCDPQRRLYEGFGLRRAQWGDVIGPKVTLQGLSALRYGMSRPRQDPMQLGGAFVLDREGEIVWSHRAANAADFVRPDRIADALAAADKEAGIGGEDDPGVAKAGTGRKSGDV